MECLSRFNDERALGYLHEHPDSSPVYPPPFSFGPIDALHHASEEPVVFRNTYDPQSDWFSQRRHSARPSHMHSMCGVESKLLGLGCAGIVLLEDGNHCLLLG
jgi:hypothetical protein